VPEESARAKDAISIMARYFFTADHHFGHTNIIRYCQRPFVSAGEMDAALVELWNETVGGDDTVYHLGDFCLGGLDRFRRVAWRLNGHLKIVPGSHDGQWLADFRADDPNLHTALGHPIEVLPPLVSLKIPELWRGRFAQIIVLCHYALRVWDRSSHGTWHLYGHSHGRLPPCGLSFDVGVDASQYRPVSLEAVAQKMKSLETHLEAGGRGR
jgi:calcineurin-like phosphoesterase family protein